MNRKAVWRLAVLAALLAGATAQSASATISAADLLARAKKAAGSLAPGSYIERYGASVGGLHLSGVKQIKGDDFSTTESDGLSAFSWGRLNGQRWHRDENGVVLFETGFEADTEDDAQLAQPGADRNVQVLGLTPDGADFITDFKLGDGLHEKRYYDAQTYLLTRVEVQLYDGNTRVRTYSDYRPVAGSMVAFSTRVTQTGSGNETAVTVQSFDPGPVQLGIPANRSLFTLTAAEQLPVAFVDAITSEMIVRVVVNGHPLNFVLDTGSDGLYIDAAAALSCGMTARGKLAGTIGGNFDVSLARASDFSVGSLHMHDINFAVIPLRGRTSAGKTDGLLGASFFANAIVGVDFKKETVTLYPPNGSPPDAAGLSVVPIDLDDGVPRAPASIEGVPGNFLIDTGGEGTMLSLRYFNRLPSRIPFNIAGQGSITAPRIGAVFIGGAVDMHPFQFNDFILGNAKFKSAVFVVPSRPISSETNYDGIIGRDVLKFYVLYFDYTGRAIYLKPNL